jgi:hypothetical protein
LLFAPPADAYTITAVRQRQPSYNEGGVSGARQHGRTEHGRAEKGKASQGNAALTVQQVAGWVYYQGFAFIAAGFHPIFTP